MRSRAAWVSGPEATYLVRLDAEDPRSPAVELIDRVSFAEDARARATGTPSRARRILRERIRVDYDLSFAESEAIKVAAKRASREDAPPPTAIALAESPAPPDFAGAPWPAALAARRSLTETEIRVVLAELRERAGRTGTRWTSDRPVSALLVDADARPIAWAWNANGIARTRHAEWNLCEFLRAGKLRIPAGATLHVSLKPCRMCAARIWETAEDPARLAVVYAEFDPGPFARETLLDAGSSARRRFLGAKHPLFRHEIQSGPRH